MNQRKDTPQGKKFIVQNRWRISSLSGENGEQSIREMEEQRINGAGKTTRVGDTDESYSGGRIGD